MIQCDACHFTTDHWLRLAAHIAKRHGFPISEAKRLAGQTAGIAEPITAESQIAELRAEVTRLRAACEPIFAAIDTEMSSYDEYEAPPQWMVDAYVALYDVLGKTPPAARAATTPQHGAGPGERE